jgi:hypothetical protein
MGSLEPSTGDTWRVLSPGDEGQDDEGHDGRMVHRGLALSGHGGFPVRMTCLFRQGSAGSDRQPGDQPGH